MGYNQIRNLNYMTNNYRSVTSPAQSRQIEDLGYSIETADFGYSLDFEEGAFTLRHKKDFKDLTNIIPCWTLGNLIDLIGFLSFKNAVKSMAYKTSEELLDWCINYLINKKRDDTE